MFFCKAPRDHWDYPLWASALHAAERKGGTLCFWAMKAFLCLRIYEWVTGRCRHHIRRVKKSSSKTILLMGKTKACLNAWSTSYSLTKKLPASVIHLHLLPLLRSPFLGLLVHFHPIFLIWENFLQKLGNLALASLAVVFNAGSFNSRKMKWEIC